MLTCAQSQTAQFKLSFNLKLHSQMPFSDVPEYNLDYKFHADKLADLLKVNQTLITLDDNDICAIQDNDLHELQDLQDLCEVIESIDMFPCFFKLSSRSAKDIGITKVNSFEDIIFQCRRSKRLKEDLSWHLANHSEDEKLFIVLRPWCDLVKDEFRLFWVDSTLTAVCSKKTGQYIHLNDFAQILSDCQANDLINLNDKFCTKMSHAGYTKYCLDVRRTFDDNLEVIEICSLTPSASCYDFEYYEILYLNLLSKFEYDEANEAGQEVNEADEAD